MRLSAHYPSDDLFRFLAQLFPLELEIGEPGDTSRRVVLHPPTTYRMVPGEGVRLTMDAEAFWPLPLVNDGLRLRGVESVVVPAVEHREDGWALVFGITIARFTSGVLPEALESVLADRLNEALAAAGVEVAWSYADTLAIDLTLPSSIVPPRTFRLRADEATLNTTEEGLDIALNLHLSFVRT